MTKITDLADELTFTSDYLTDAFYDELQEFADSGRSLGASTDAVLRSECEALLCHEARLIDEQRYGEWLALFARQCIYWVPFDDRADPRGHVNLAFDDRRRLEDRLLRLRSGYAHTMRPDRRFQHLVANVEAWEIGAERRRVVASQLVFEYRAGHEITRHVFRSDHLLMREDGAWRVRVKRCVLLNRDAAMEPPTLL
jgi:3-phenylpropionate/cinnamic acid dioxygenase small subunit